MESIPPSKRNTQADIQLRTRQTNHQQETDGCIQIKHNPEHQPSRMSSKSTAYVPPKTASTPTKANTQTCSYLDFNQFLIRRITRNICLRLRIKQIQILTCREQDILKCLLLLLLVGDLGSIVYGSIDWCVWSFNIAALVWLPHLKC